MPIADDSQQIAWFGADSDPRLPLLRHFGLQIVPGSEGDPVQASILASAPRSIADLPTIPTLLLVDSAEQEAQWLSQAPDHVEPVREPASALLLYERLRRLLQRQANPARWATAAPLDSLTGCLSRAGWTRQLQQRLTQPSTDASALMLLDMDGFRSFNELHGHVAGDHALAEVARRCRQALGPNDVLGRWSGDAFALLLQRYDSESLLQDAQALRALVSTQPLAVTDQTGLRRWIKSSATEALIPPSASAGMAWLSGATSFADLLAEADAALQQARRQGGAQLVLSGRPRPAQPRSAAQADTVSQMPNRAYCDARLSRESEAADRESWPLALWLVDLRGLAALNASLGYAQGDRALTALATAIRSQARLMDWTARVRASSFAVVMPRTDADGAQRAVERLRQALAGLEMPLSDSLVLRRSGEPAPDLLARAWQQRLPLQPAQTAGQA